FCGLTSGPLRRGRDWARLRIFRAGGAQPDTSTGMTVAVGGDDALELAQSAFDLVEADASAAATLAGRAVRLARKQRHPEAEIAALHALSFAQHELGDDRAIRTIRRAVRSGERHGLTRRTALARRRLALDLAGRGAITAALRELELA